MVQVNSSRYRPHFKLDFIHTQKVGFTTTFVIGSIPGFGQVTISVMSAAMLGKEIIRAFGKGIDSSKIPCVDEAVKCYQNHPLATHEHTVSSRRYPFKRKLRIADDFNEAIGSISQAFHTYKKKKEDFYQTLTQEFKECEADYYRLTSIDAFRSAWVELKYQQKPRKALVIINRTIATLNASKKVAYRPKRELYLLKAFILEHLGEKRKAQAILDSLPFRTHRTPLTDIEKVTFSEMLLDFAKEDFKDISPFNAIKKLAQGYLCFSKKVEGSPIEAVNLFLEKYPLAIHGFYFFKALFNNLKILKEQGLLGQLTLDVDAAEKKEISICDIINLHYEMEDLLPNTDELKPLLNFIENAALCKMSLNALSIWVDVCHEKGGVDSPNYYPYDSK